MQDKDCNFFKDQIYSYLSDGLSDEETAELLAHIESCPDCMRELDMLKSIISASAALPQIEVPDGLKASVFERIEAEKQRMVPKRYKFKRFAAVALPLAACIALSVGVFSGGLYDKFVASDNIISSGEFNPAPIETNTAQTDTAENNAQTNIAENKSQSDTSAEAVSDTTPKSVPSKKAAPQPGAEQHNNDDVSVPQSNTSAEPGAGAGYDNSPAADDTPSAEEAVTDTPQVASFNAPRERFAAAPSIEDTDDVADTENDSIAISDATSAKDVISVPVSCIVITENISAFCDKFGITANEGELHFELDADKWQDFLSFAENTGAKLNADYSAENNGCVSITICMP